MHSEVVIVKPGGWCHLHERRELLAATESNILYSGLSDSELPDEVLPVWTKIENQGPQGACQGHALTSGMELLVTINGGEYVQLSRACAYYQSQRMDGIRGDNGSTIEGGIRLAMTDGVCLEEVWPYPPQYDNRIPSAYRESLKYRIKGHSKINSYDDLIMHTGRFGPTHIGIMWGEDLDQQVARYGIISRYAPQRGWSGHSVELTGYSLHNWDGNTFDRRHPVLDNSWSPRWGRKGRCLVTPGAIEQMLGHQFTVFRGLQGIELPTPIIPVYGELN